MQLLYECKGAYVGKVVDYRDKFLAKVRDRFRCRRRSLYNTRSRVFRGLATARRKSVAAHVKFRNPGTFVKVQWDRHSIYREYVAVGHTVGSRFRSLG